MSRPLGHALPMQLPDFSNSFAKDSQKKCLALDLDETLVHSSFQPVKIASFTIPVNIEGVTHNVYVIKRPGNLYLHKYLFHWLLSL